MTIRVSLVYFFFFNDTATTEIYTLSLHDALPISVCVMTGKYTGRSPPTTCAGRSEPRSEEHTSELQSQSNLVCRLLLEKKKKLRKKIRRKLDRSTYVHTAAYTIQYH